MGAGSSVDVSEFEDDRLIRLLEQVKGQKVGNIDLSEDNVNDIVRIIEQSKRSTSKNQDILNRNDTVEMLPQPLSPTQVRTSRTDKQTQLKSAKPMKISSLDVMQVLSVITSDELSSDSKDGGVTSQVSIGGRVYFLVVKNSDNLDNVLVLKFCKNSIETLSEAFANQVAACLGVKLAPLMLLRKPNTVWSSIADMLDSANQDESCCALKDDMNRSSCLLVQEFIIGKSFRFHDFSAKLSHLDPQVAHSCGEALGSIYIADLVLRNCDRLIDADLEWRGNLTNMMLSIPSPDIVQLIGIDTCICRRPPRLLCRSDLTRIPHSLQKAFDTTLLPVKLASMLGSDEMEFGLLHGKDELLVGFHLGVRLSLSLLKEHVPGLESRYNSLKQLFDDFFKKTEVISTEKMDDDKTKKNKKTKKTRPGTARVREIGKVLKASTEGVESDWNEGIRQCAAELERQVASLPLSSPFSVLESGMSEGPSLFSSSYEEMVRLEHMLVRCELILRESTAFLDSAITLSTPCDEQEAENVPPCDEQEAENVPPVSPQPLVTPGRSLPPVVLHHPLAAAATLASITKKLKDTSGGDTNKEK